MALLAVTLACGGGEAAPASVAAPSPTLDPAIAAYRTVVTADQSNVRAAVSDFQKNCTFQYTSTGSTYVPDLAHCIPAVSAMATSVRRMKGDLGAYAVPPMLTAANAVLIADLTSLATAADDMGAQIGARGENYGGAACCNDGFLSLLQQEQAAVRAITG